MRHWHQSHTSGAVGYREQVGCCLCGSVSILSSCNCGSIPLQISREPVRLEYYIIEQQVTVTEPQMFVNSWQSRRVFSTANTCSNIFHLQVVLLSYMSNSSTHSLPWLQRHTHRATWDWKRQKHPAAHAHSCCHYHMENQLTAKSNNSDAWNTKIESVMHFSKVECLFFASLARPRT